MLFASNLPKDVWIIQSFPAYLRDADSIFITYTDDNKSFYENTDGRKVDLIVLPLGHFDTNGEWLKKCVEEYERIGEDLSIGNVLKDEEEKDGKIYADDQIAAIAKDGKAELEYIISIQEAFFAVISID